MEPHNNRAREMDIRSPMNRSVREVRQNSHPESIDRDVAML